MKQEVCINHDDHAAIEHCEVCGDPLCGLCLWYSQDGRRLCERHAAELEAGGEKVLPPETYEEAISMSLRRAAPPGAAPQPGRYIGNSNDLIALVAAVASVTTLLSCAGGAYCIPLLAGLAGIAVYLNADKAEEPGRTRTLGVVGVASLALMFLGIMAFVLFYVSIFAIAGIAASGAGP